MAIASGLGGAALGLGPAVLRYYRRKVFDIECLKGCNMDKISTFDIELALKKLIDWKLDSERTSISRKFVFADFIEAFAFMQSIAFQAQLRDHHPEWSNVYNAVHICWTSHDAKALTQRDIAMATYCDELFASIRVGKHAKQ